MQVIISGRHVTVTEGMKQHIEAKTMDIMSRKSLKITSMRVILSLENQSRYKAEIIVNMKNHTFEADAETHDVYDSIDAAVDKVSSQIKKLADKVQDHRKAPLSEIILAEDLDEEAELEYELD